MKNILFVAFMLLASMTFCSCDSSKKELRANVESVNSECPIDLGMFGEISSMEFNEDEDEVVFTMTISKDMPIKISALNKLKNTLKRAMLGSWAESEDGIKMMKVIAKADSKITIVLQTEGTNQNVNIKVSKDEVRDLADGKIDPISPRDLLETYVTSTNAQCPMQVDELTTLSSASLEGDNFVYNYSIDESSISMASIEENRESIKANLKQVLSGSDPTIKQMVSVCKNADTGILYRYVGDISGNVCIIKFSPSELSDF